VAVNGLRGVSLGDLYKAYRKSKADAYYDRGHFHSLAYAEYELNLEANLKSLLASLKKDFSWAQSKSFLGVFSYQPKSVDVPASDSAQEIHFATLDPVRDWINSNKGKKSLSANFRIVIVASINYQVVCALWIIKIGHKFDDRIDRKLAFAHALKRVGRLGKLNEDSHQLFAPYFSGYRAWRSKALEAMRSSLNDGRSIVAITMDIKSFYHQVSPNFLVKSTFLKKLEIELDPDELAFSKAIVESMQAWHRSTPEAKDRPEGSLPVGLSISKLISNVLLADFDNAVSSLPSTIHYGRYADDIILVTEDPGISTGQDYIKWLRWSLDEYLVLDQTSSPAGLKLKLNYSTDSEIIFSAKKQKIFFLSGEHGLDLVGQVEEQIRKQSSEYRLLPELPDNDSEMLASALLATPDARLEADALRKAEAVSLRRLGFSMLLSDFEAYARDLDYKDPKWTLARKKFYAVVGRYLVTPVGFFDYYTYIVRVFGLMVACRDFADARLILGQLERIGEVLQSTTTAGTRNLSKYFHARRNYYRGFVQAALESSTVAAFEFNSRFTNFLKVLAAEADFEVIDGKHIKELSKRLLLSDLGRRCYQDYWYAESPKEVQPPLPASISVKRALARIRSYRNKAKKSLTAPYWPAIAFPTRPPALWQLSLSVPKALEESGGLESLLWAVRGGYVRSDYRNYRFLSEDDSGERVWNVPSEQGLQAKIAVPSIKVTDDQWTSAVKGMPDHSLDRYLATRKIVNDMIRGSLDLNYIVFPELSIPYWWALDIAAKLSRAGISFVAGVETRGSGDEYRNDVLVSLATDFYGRRGNICFLQPKIDLSHEESANIKHLEKKYLLAGDVGSRRPVYCHGEFAMGVLICSDLTTIQNRARFQGCVDALFVVEWNKDIETFDFLVESAAHDLHAAVVQVNNRRFGDSRIRMPFAEGFKRDVVKVKGGDSDFFVHCLIDVAELRRFQSKKSVVKRERPKKDDKPKFKPIPIGYRMSDKRRGR